MIKNHKFLSLFAITLVAALLLSMSGKATSVYALAELAPEVAPVFDTQIYQLKDYIDNGGMTDPQLDIFYTLAGFYALGQAGSENYKLTNPYSTQSGVLNWLKDLGVETYNTLIGLVPDTVRLPNGSIQSTEVIKKAASLYVANLMGCALKAYQYNTYEDFEDDIENSDNFFIPWNRNTQYGLNTLYQLYGGIYEWQFKTQPFKSSVTYKITNTVSGAIAQQYNDYKNTLPEPLVRANSTRYNWYNCIVSASSSWFDTYNCLLLNTNYNGFQLYSSSGVPAPNISYNSCFYTQSFNFGTSGDNNTYIGGVNFNPVNYNSYVDIVRALYNFELGQFLSGYNLYLEDWVQHVYVGDSWANRHEIFNIQDLNLDDTGNGYYVAPPEEHDYLLDIKGILQDILNNTNLYNVFIDNIYTPDGVLVHDIDLIRISTDIYDLLNQQNPPLPVNLNDVSDYIDNTYLDLVKQHGENFGETIGEYVAFWHNADPEITYVIFGALILTLVGAFVGKWGHS